MPSRNPLRRRPTMPPSSRSLLARRKRYSVGDSALARAVDVYRSVSRSAKSDAEIRHALLGFPKNVLIGDRARRDSRFKERVHATRASVAGRLAKMAVDNPSFLSAIEQKKYVYIDRNNRVVSTNIPKGIYPRVPVRRVKELRYLFSNN